MVTRFGLRHLIAWLAEGAGARMEPASNGADDAFATVTLSSRRDGYPPMEEGGLFVAIRSERRDGHDFAADAFRNGARAALVARVPENLQPAVARGEVAVVDFRGRRPAPTGGERLDAQPAAKPVLVLVDDPVAALQGCAAWWRRRHRARVIAITGSVGKTTTKDLAAGILARRYRVLRTEGNLNNEYGLPFMLLKLTAEHERAVLEIGISAVGEMETFAGMAAPDVAIVTRVAPAHLQQLGDIATVEREKGRLVEALPADGLAVLNADDERVARMAGRTVARAVLYGERECASVRATDVDVRGFDGLAFTLHRAGHSRRVQVPLVGRHFVTCALAAAAAAFEEGCTWDEVAAGLAEPPATRRLVPRMLASGATLLDDTDTASPAAP